MPEISPVYPEVQQFIAGSWIPANGHDTSSIVNPATGNEIGNLSHATIDDLADAVTSAANAFRAWRKVSAYERAKLLQKAANLLRARVDSIAALMTLEQGKPLTESRIEVAAAADIFEWFGEEGRRAYGRVVPSRAASLRYVVLREPVGPVAAFAPWNFPAVIPARKIAASLAAGCTCVIKPAEETPATTLALARALDDAGLPKGVLNVVTGRPAFISETLLASPFIRKLSFTGSIAVGKQLLSLCAATVKRTTMELGGHAPVLVFEDADLETAVAACVAAKFRNAGQVCIAPTRFFVHANLHDAFAEKFAERAAALKVADGFEPGAQMGPMANPRRVAAMRGFVDDALDHGARLVTGGTAPNRAGFFWNPTVLADVPPGARVMREEPFGPIAVTAPFETKEEAFGRANALPYGLAAYAFTSSSHITAALMDEVECGMLGINNFAINLPETPFGGVKESGYGSEGGSEGLDAYLNTKLVSLS
jgi:succinate-semialdehyde dehydrogenase / glutarate-semialdehyde dehydrogenase